MDRDFSACNFSNSVLAVFPAAGGKLPGAVGRREDGDPVAAQTELAREPVDVLVDVVRLRPGEGRDEGDRKCHRSHRV